MKKNAIRVAFNFEHRPDSCQCDERAVFRLPAVGGDDTFGIYQLQSVDARPAVEKLTTAGADAIIISGTGMPSLSLLKAAEQMDIKIMSSNYATAIKGLAHLNLEPTTSSHWS